MDYISIKISENYNLYNDGTNNTIHKSGNDYQKPTIGYGYDIKQNGFNAQDLNSKAGTTIITQEQMDLLESYCNALIKNTDENDAEYDSRVKLIKENYNTLISSITITQSQANTLLNNTVSSYETALNSILNEYGVSLLNYQKSALISVFYNTCGGTVEAIKNQHSTLLHMLAHLKTTNTNEQKFIGALGIWYEILYRTNPSSNGENQYGIQNRRFLEVNEFWGNHLTQTPTFANAQSIIPINNYEEANIAIAFMNQNKDAMKNKLDNITNYKNNPYKYIRNNFSSAVSTFLSNQNYNGNDKISSLFTEWNLYTDLQIDLDSNGRPNGTTCYGNITGSNKRDLIFITGNQNGTTVHAGAGDDYIKSSSATDIIVDAGSGNDKIFAGNGNNEINGGSGNDIISTGSGNDIIHAGTGRDDISAGGGINYIYLGNDNMRDDVWLSNSSGGIDHIYQTTSNDVLHYNSAIATTEYSGKNIIHTLVNGAKVILYDFYDEDHDSFDENNLPAAGFNGAPLIVFPDDSVWGYGSNGQGYQDTGFELSEEFPGEDGENGEIAQPQKPSTPPESSGEKFPILPSIDDPYDSDDIGDTPDENPDGSTDGLKGNGDRPLSQNDIDKGINDKANNTSDLYEEIKWRPDGFKLQAKPQIKQIIKTAEDTRSPLIIDLDGDGVETTTLDGGVHFDHDGNGFAEKTAWVGKDDGLLVRDINGNGQIDDGTELFGNNTILSNGQKAANGFEALKDLDSNNDGIFNNQDAAWNQVKIWKDKNQNGRLDAGELLSLNEAGIEEINLNYQNSTLTDENGNTIGQTGSFTKEDGTTGSVNDIWFNTDLMNTVDKTNIQIPEEIKALPDVQGFGNVHSLQIAMAIS